MRIGTFSLPILAFSIAEPCYPLNTDGSTTPIWEALIRDIFSKVVVVRAETKFELCGGVEYVGVSPMFAEVPIGCRPLEYGINRTEWVRYVRHNDGAIERIVTRYELSFVQGALSSTVTEIAEEAGV